MMTNADECENRGLRAAGPLEGGVVSVRTKLIAVTVPVAVSLAMGLAYGPFILDDTYIGLRYMENMARGHGFVFNAGEPVLAVTSPLYCLALVVVRLIGFDLEAASVAFGTVGVAVMVGLAVLIALRWVGPGPATALGLFIALFPTSALTANTGMETGVSLALIFLAYHALFAGRFATAGLVIGLELQVRPDAAILALVAGTYVLVKDPGKLLRFAIPLILAVIPWTIYATWVYGSPIPHTITAKQANHATPALTIIKQLAVLAALLGPVSIFALAGAFRAVRERSEAAAIVAWVLLYSAGLVLAGIDPILFVWYFSPLLPPWAMLAALGLDWAGKALAKRRSRPDRAQRTAARGPAAAMIVLALAFGAGTFPLRDFLKRTGYDRVDRYLEIGAWLAARAEPGEVVMVAECGGLSYALMDHYIFDQSGLNNPEVYEICRIGPGPKAGGPPDPRPQFLTQECELALIQHRRPDYIATFVMFMHVDELGRDPWFQENYRRVPCGGPEMEYYYIFEKIKGPGPGT